MHWLGGKSRLAKPISEILNAQIAQVNAPAFYEPFVGGLNITPKILAPKRVASDISCIIHTYEAMLRGWVPPVGVLKSEYQMRQRAFRDGSWDPTDPANGFILYGYSFAGGFARGYAAPGPKCQDYGLSALRSLTKKLSTCQDVQFLRCPYYEVNVAPGSVVYCDPPYANTCGYRETGKFDHAKFWDWVRLVSRHSHVFVSEYAAPPDFEEIASFKTMTELRTKQGRAPRIERVFKVRLTSDNT